MIAILTGVRWCIIVVLIFISLIIWDVENLFTYFVGYPNVFFEKNVFGNSLPTFYWIVYGGFFGFVFCLLLLSCLGFLCILDINPLLDKWFCRYFLQLPRLPFHFVDGFLFVHRSFLVRCSLTSLFLLFLFLLLESDWKIQHQKWFQSAYCLLFSTGSFMVSGLTFKSDPSWVNFFFLFFNFELIFELR